MEDITRIREDLLAKPWKGDVIKFLNYVNHRRQLGLVADSQYNKFFFNN